MVMLARQCRSYVSYNLQNGRWMSIASAGPYSGGLRLHYNRSDSGFGLIPHRGISRLASRFKTYSDDEPPKFDADGNTAKQRRPLWSSAISPAKRFFRDLTMINAYLSIQSKLFKFRARHDTIATLLQRNAAKQPDKLALISDESQMTFKQVEDYSNQIANTYRQISLNRHDTVALFGTSSPQYVSLWLGLSKLELRTALINSNLRTDALMHSISTVNAKAIIVDAALTDNFETVREKLSKEVQVFYYSSNPKTERPSGITAERWLNSLIANASTIPPSKPKIKKEDIILYVYTSGTTGLPKACIISQERFMLFSTIIKVSAQVRKSDITYTVLPLYHVTAGIATIGQALVYGSTVVTKKKFSASQYWADVIKYQCTVVSYIGEMCRFLMAQPSSDLEKKHRVRMAFGQGLRLGLWHEFMDRFNIREIQEMYGATESNAGMTNLLRKPGAVGYLSPFWGKILPAQVVISVNKETGELIPDENGMHPPVPPGVEGELVGPITTDPLRKFEGYTDKKAGSSKIVENVLKKGDKFFRTGDLVIRDKEGFIFFVDRIGDTFRWKGENVSTTEIEGIISKLWNYADVAVYGVEIPGRGGKAGMVSVAGQADSFDINSLYEQLSNHLPNYAVPLFIRFSDFIDLTGTFKIQKARFKREGFDLTGHHDKIYYLDTQSKMYKLLTSDVVQAINDEKIRF